jgi:predicted N-acetyltransferase YhbS
VQVTIRPARPEEIPAIQAVGLDADLRYADLGRPELVDGTTIPTPVAERAVAEGRLWVAEGGGEVLGWAYTGRVAGELCLGQLSVARRHGGQGVGTALLRRVIEEAQRRGEPSILLNTQLDIPWNGPWYARHGFISLTEQELTPSLRALTEDQRAQGVDWSARVHMRRTLAGLG